MLVMGVLLMGSLLKPKLQKKKNERRGRGVNMRLLSGENENEKLFVACG
jgi:hypothetical protein